MGFIERGAAKPTIKILHLVAQTLGVSAPELFEIALTENSSDGPDTGNAAAHRIPSGQYLPPQHITHSV